MDFGSSRVYDVELWSSNGTKLADISSLCQNRLITQERNEAEVLTFDLDLAAFETFAASMNADPRTLLQPYQTDVKLKRLGQYWLGLQVVSVVFNLPSDGAGISQDGNYNSTAALQQRITVTCTGYLNLFKDRYVTATYSSQDAAFIAGDLLTQTQSQTGGSVGVSIGSSNYMTGVLRDRTYTRQNVKSGVQNLTTLVDGRFDFAFTWDKQFKTYSQIGSKRTDIAFQYGGAGSNIIGFYMERSATNLYNRVIGLGSGFGADQLTSVQDDVTSRTANFLREDIRQYNSVSVQTTLDQNAAADLALEKDLLEIPQITISGKELANVPFLSIGDRIPISAPAHTMLANITGYYRIEKMVIALDDNDFEQAIQLYFDNFAVV